MYNINEDNYLLKQLKMSKYMKVKNKWDEHIGKGFIVEDIEKIQSLARGIIYLKLKDNNAMKIKISQLNLGETKELIKFLEIKIEKDKLNNKISEV